MILIACALDGEAEAFVAALEERKELLWKGRRIYSGLLESRETVVAVTGAGKVQTALVLQHVIDEFFIESVIFSGIGGALGPDAVVGEVVVGISCIQHDVDASRFGFSPGEVPGTGISRLDADDEMARAALDFRPSGYRVRGGRIATGDHFVDSKEEKNRLNRLFSGDVVDMEGAAAAFTAEVNGIPWIILKVVSDGADGEVSKRYKHFLKNSSGRSLETVRHILRALT